MSKPIIIDSKIDSSIIRGFRSLSVYLNNKHIVDDNYLTDKYYIPCIQEFYITDGSAFFKIVYTNPVTDVSYMIDSNDPCIKADLDLTVLQGTTLKDVYISPCCITLTNDALKTDVYNPEISCGGDLSCHVDNERKSLVFKVNKNNDFIQSDNETDYNTTNAIKYINGIQTTSGSMNITGKGGVVVAITNKNAGK